MITRPTVATAAAVALAVTGITYTSVSAYEPAQAAPGLQQAAAPVPASAPTGGDSGKDNGGKDSEGGDSGEGNGGKDNGGKDSEGGDFEGEDNGGKGNGGGDFGKDNGGKDSEGEDNGGKGNGGGDFGKDNGGKDSEGGDFEGEDNGGKDSEGGDFEGEDHEGRGFEGRIHINERSYSAAPGGCITVVSGLGSRSLNIRNDSRRTVEVFRGATCDNGAPIATVGPHSSSDGVRPRHVEGGVFVKNGVVGSFRVVKRHFGEFGGNDGFGGR
ncbi:hypothetical protein [Streptomyces hirsutus]|uniref:hypothetical protein n=1 Tax=Streptomyces hirsutus TaxID=35620 RepID=UPI0006E2BEFE|nr:hypothetical protein [Streptomyces hirsutus]